MSTLAVPSFSAAAFPLTAISVAAFLAYFVLYPVAVYFYDAKGLRKYPALDPTAGIWNLSFIVETHRGFRSKTLAKLHKTHPVIRIGPNHLSYGNVSAIKDIYGHNTKAVKDESYNITAGSHFHLADVVEKHEHARKRKVLASAYALKNLEGWEHKVADKTVRLVKQFDERCTAPLAEGRNPEPKDLTIDYRAWTNFFTLDAIADIGLSERLGFLDQGDDVCTAERGDGYTWKTHFRPSLYEHTRKQSLWLASYGWYKTLMAVSNVVPFYAKLAANSPNWDGIVLNRSTTRMKRYQAGEKLDDFFQALMEDKNGGPNMLPWGEIVAEVSIMMNAGSVTTAIAMANVLLQLLKNPDVLQKVRAEVDAVLDDDEVIAPYDKVKHLPYMRACLDESLRLFPPTTHGLPRETPAEGMPVLGDWIAGGTTVSMSAYVAHRDESVWSEPESFIPERWLGDKGKELQPYFVSFSAGARGCIGRNISYLEQAVLLATVLHRYEFALPTPDWDIKRLETLNLILGEMPVKVWRRTTEHGDVKAE